MNLNDNNADRVDNITKSIRSRITGLLEDLHELQKLTSASTREISNMKCLIWNALITEKLDNAPQFNYCKGDNKDGK